MVHRNAPLSETGRLRLARCIVDDHWPLRRAAERFQVSVTTAARGQTGIAKQRAWPTGARGRIAVPAALRPVASVESSRSESSGVGAQHESPTY